MSANFTNTATGTGTTAGLQLSAGSRWALQVTSGTWGSATIESSADGGSSWTTVENASGTITFTANKTIVVHGGLKYRLNVASYSAAITMTAQPVSH